MGAGPEGRPGFAADGLEGGPDVSVVTTAGQTVDLRDSSRRFLCTLALSFRPLPSDRPSASRPPAEALLALSTPVAGLLSSPTAGRRSQTGICAKAGLLYTSDAAHEEVSVD